MTGVKRSNPKALEGIKVHLDTLEKYTAKVGWFESAQYEDGTPIAYVAAIQEYGYGPIPPRPFMRPTVAEQSPAWARKAASGAKALLRGEKTAEQVMQALAEKAQGDVTKKIKSITQPGLSKLTIGMRAYRQKYPNAPITAKTLGEVAQLLRDNKLDVSGISTKPLNDTGRMLATLTNVVEESE